MSKLNLITLTNISLTLMLCYLAFSKTSSVIVTVLTFSILMFSTYVVKSILEKY